MDHMLRVCLLLSNETNQSEKWYEALAPVCSPFISSSLAATGKYKKKEGVSASACLHRDCSLPNSASVQQFIYGALAG